MVNLGFLSRYFIRYLANYHMCSHHISSRPEEKYSTCYQSCNPRTEEKAHIVVRCAPQPITEGKKKYMTRDQLLSASIRGMCAMLSANTSSCNDESRKKYPTTNS